MKGKRFVRILGASSLVAITITTILAMWTAGAETYAHYRPEYKQIDLLPMLQKDELTEEEYETHKDAVKDEVRQRRAKHAVYENQRTIRAVEALKAQDVALFGELMNASHVSLRDDYEVSCPEMDILAEEAWKIPGVLGSRMTGGGFGGCTVSIVESEQVDAFIETVGTAYEERTGIKAEFYVVDIGQGAGVL